MVQIRRYAASAAIGLAVAFTASCGDDPADPSPATGSIQVSIAGLPDTINAGVTLTGPGGFSTTITAAKTIPALVPGTYTISVARVVTSTATFVPAFESLPVEVSASSVNQVAVIYSVTTGSIAMVVTGIPSDVPGRIIVTGPNGFRDSVSATRTLGNLAQGVYTISVTEVSRGLSIYSPRTTDLVVTVSPSITPVRTTVEYQLVTGTLNVNVHGLPGGLDAAITVSGPAGYTASGTGSLSLEGLRQGRYTVVASSVGSGASLRHAAPTTQSVAVIAGSVAVANVNYWLVQPPAGLNLTVDAVQLQQVVQAYGGTVPTIAGRDALLRVFVRASEPNAVSPAVRVRLFDGALLVATHTIPAPGAGVPVTIAEGLLTSSWNLPLPAPQVRPGLRVLADVDPGNAIIETAEGDNAWPSSGSPLALDVRTTPPLTVRIVPITVSGLTGNVNAGNIALYEVAARQFLPVTTLTTELRPTFTSSAPPLEPNDANGAWPQVLSELNALRTLEGSQGHYYGVVKLPYSTGVVGVSYLPSFAAIGLDSMPNAASTFVHELGHHFGRLHAPACGAGGTDANYPHPGGSIGAYGFDATTMTMRPPSTTDIMGYCEPRWISDYTFTGILAYRAGQGQPNAAAVVGRSAERGLLLWGRIGPRGIVLEPAFEVDAMPSLPSVAGPHRLEVTDASGRAAWSATFQGERIVDSPSHEEHFAFVVPMTAFGGSAVARVRLAANGLRAELAAARSPASTGDFAAVAQRATGETLTLTWQPVAGRGVLVRDARTGAVLALGRGGRLYLKSSAQTLDLTFSDGVRSTRRSVVVR